MKDHDLQKIADDLLDGQYSKRLLEALTQVRDAQAKDLKIAFEALTRIESLTSGLGTIDELIHFIAQQAIERIGVEK